MNQKVKIWFLVILWAFTAHCEVTVSATDGSNTQEISFKSPTADTSKHIRVEYSFTVIEPINIYKATYIVCGTHDEGDTLMTTNSTPGFFIEHLCDGSSSCYPLGSTAVSLDYVAGEYWDLLIKLLFIHLLRN